MTFTNIAKKYLEYTKKSLPVFLLFSLVVWIIAYISLIHSDAMSLALSHLYIDSYIIKKFGKPEFVLLIPIDSYYQYVNGTGDSELRLWIHGTKKSGQVLVRLKKDNGIWKISEIQ